VRKLLLSGVVLLVLFCSIGCNRILLSNEVSVECNIISSQMYTAHDPMVIDSNDDFVSEGWSGDGSLDRPYTISFLEFTDEIDEACINISYTTAYFVITNCSFNTTTFSCAINLQNVSNGRIQYCTTGGHIWGITVYESIEIQLLDLTLSGTCVVMEDSEMCLVSHCSIEYAPGDGVYFEGCYNMTVEGCDISYCAANGIWLEDTYNSSIIGNKIDMNTMYQIEISGVSSHNLIYNNIMYCDMFNWGTGHDGGVTNYWDDSVSTGNWWYDYDDSGQYDIPGTAGSIDHYPMGHSSVVLVNHNDVDFIVNSDASIIWDAFSEAPDYFIVYRNGEIHESGVWDGQDVSTNVMTDILGSFNYTLFVNGTSGYYKIDTVMVTIFTILPLIDSPNDISYKYGTTGNSITWHPSSKNPDSYEIYQNNLLIFSQSWHGSSVSYSVDGLSIGIHSFKLRVNNTMGNDANDTVRVTVTPASTTTTTGGVTNTTSTSTTVTDFQLDTRIILFIGIGGVILLIAVLVVKSRK
jgi:parallel beta-helix repeat protein